LWLFTDPALGGADLERVVARLPRGLCGVVFRHDGVAGRASLLRRLAAVCRARNILLVSAGAGAVPRGVGRHLRGGRGRRGGTVLVTSSAHGRAELVRARRAGAALAFLSPVLPTASHPGAPALGVVRWAGLARGAGLPVFALGGMTGLSARHLPRWVAGVGAIRSLLP